MGRIKEITWIKKEKKNESAAFVYRTLKSLAQI